MESVQLPKDTSHGNILGAATAGCCDSMAQYDPRRLLSTFWSTCPRGECPSEHALWPSMRITETTLYGDSDLVARVRKNLNRMDRLNTSEHTDPSNTVHCGPREPPYRAVSPPQDLPIAATLTSMRRNDAGLMQRSITRHAKCNVSLKQDGKRLAGPCDEVAKELRKIARIALGQITDMHTPDGATLSGPFSTWATRKWLATYNEYPS